MYRIMMEGEDHTIWCETNHKSYEWCEEHGDELCDKYESAIWWIESEDPFAERGYEDDNGEW